MNDHSFDTTKTNFCNINPIPKKTKNWKEEKGIYAILAEIKPRKAKKNW